MFGIFLTPVFFYVIQWFTDRWPKSAAEEELALAPDLDGFPAGHSTHGGDGLTDRPG